MSRNLTRTLDLVSFATALVSLQQLYIRLWSRLWDLYGLTNRAEVWLVDVTDGFWCVGIHPDMTAIISMLLPVENINNHPIRSNSVSVISTHCPVSSMWVVHLLFQLVLYTQDSSSNTTGRRLSCHWMWTVINRHSSTTQGEEEVNDIFYTLASTLPTYTTL